MVVWLNEEKSNCLLKENIDVIILSTFFKLEDKLLPNLPMDYKLTSASILLLEKVTKALKYGGLLFIYGLPHHLAIWGQYVSLLYDEEKQMVFKYWIALDIDNLPSINTLDPSHLGLLMFSKSKPKALSPTSFHLNTDLVRVPHSYCSACGQNVKDWGGKKHLMNPNGRAISDVWRDLPKIDLKNNVIPKAVLNRIETLTKKDNTVYLHITQTQPNIETIANKPIAETKLNADSDNEKISFNILEKDKVYQGDSISFLRRVSQLHPQGIFDLVFADPPYNLKKGYNRYEDSLAEKNYIEWCNKWLGMAVKTLKPGGTLIVLNLPKWAIHHAAFLNTKLEFRNWIVWNALSDPRGKMMPAHYALLYYTKIGKNNVFNYSSLENNAPKNTIEGVLSPDSPEYCLRAPCVKKRKLLGADKKVALTDIWFDIHRIKHKRDRDSHPCQLPEKLMERIISLTTNKGDLVFDPFCGVGTTAIAAHKLGRRFITIDIDPNYVRIAKEKILSLQVNLELFGNFVVPKQPVKKAKPLASKREIEIYLQKLAKRLGREPLETDILSDNPDILQKIDLLYPNRLAAIKRCRIVLKENVFT